MNFDYEKIRRQHDDGGSHWASYSDLFMALSFLFLLLYVVASFRTGTVSHSAKLKQIDLVEDQRRLQEQIRVYERISKNYVDEEATKAEKKLYKDVMSQLDLLEDKSAEKQNSLKKQLAAEMQKSEKLNRYQETIKNLITANMNSTKDVKVREKKLSQRVKELNELEFALRKKQRELNVTGEELDKTVSRLRETSRREQQTRLAAAQKEKELKTKIESITEESKQKLEEARREIESRQAALQEKTQQLEDAKGTIAEQAQRNQQLIKQVESAQAKSQAKIQELEQAHQALLDEEKRKYQETLKKTQLTAQEKLEAEREYRSKIEAEAQKFNSRLSGLKNELQQRDQKMTELKDKQRSLASQNANLSKSLASAKNEQGKLKEALQERQAEAAEMAKALKAAQEKANRRKEVAKKIAESFRNSGLDVSVNPDNGDLILNFGQEYFDTGKYFIKPGMTEVLNQAVPIYAKSLFEDTSISRFINSVEIVGFASPTYKNRVVDPSSLDPRDRTANNYNLDLSYKRARAIFKHIFNTNKMNFNYQQRLLPLVKVTGRSFFTQEIQGGIDSNMDMKSFCEKFDCKKSQNVIIRFNLKD